MGRLSKRSRAGQPKWGRYPVIMFGSLWSSMLPYSTPEKRFQQTVKHKAEARVREGVKAVLGEDPPRLLSTQTPVGLRNGQDSMLGAVCLRTSEGDGREHHDASE
jgi:hypothetical protein